MDDKNFAHLTSRIEALLALDLSCYKPGQMRRRLATFIARKGGLPPAVFARRLEKDSALLDELRDMLTINVTEFYRDPTQWERLRRAILPTLLRRPARLKIWSAGCSNGGEPYSLAILAAESGALRRTTILASDIDRTVLAQARAAGPYHRNELHKVPSKLVEKYFVAAGDRYTVAGELRQRVKFQELNLLADRYSVGFNLILCRNVLIYFEDHVKRSMLRRFRASLAPQGVLFLGATESILDAETLGFDRVEGNFYRARPAA